MADASRICSATYSYLAKLTALSNIVTQQASTTQMTTTQQYDGLGHLTSISSVPSVSSVVSSAYAYRKAEYFSKELAALNVTQPVWVGITNIAVVNDGANPDIVTTNQGHLFLGKNPEVFSHDADGNLKQDAEWKMTWDGENRLVSLETTFSAAAAGKPRQKLEFAYDGKSRRIQRRVYGWDTDHWSLSADQRFVYDGWNLISVLNSAPSPQTSFLWGKDLSGSMQGAGGVGGLLAVHNHPSPTGTHFAAYDGNGNLTALVSSADGTESARYEYGPFGELLRASGAMAPVNPFRFSTKYQDDETDQLYYGYRFYNPSTGRWLNRDPIEENGGKNLLAFVRNEAVSDFDALGKLSRQECLAKLRGLKTHIKEVKDHFSPNHCAALRAALELFEDSPCQKWAGSLDSDLKDVIDVFNQFCKPGMKERKLPIPKICERCVEPKRVDVGKWIAVGALCTAGTAIIIFDIVTVPSGEGACGAALIRYACAL